jgi:tripartite-type tricarboxylate transporter receptor subunit TctC
MGQGREDSEDRTVGRFIMLKLAIAGLALTCLGATTAAHAQSDYPNRPVRIVVPVAAGGGVDTLARIYAQHMSKVTGQTFYVENRTGAGNIIGIETAARSAPDGHTLLVAAPTITLNHFVYKKLPYDVERDFTPVTQMVSLPNVLVAHPSLSVSTLAEFIALAKAKPGQINYGSAGIGSSLHLGMELFKHMAEVDLVHVPYRGIAPAMQDLVAGHVTAMVSNVLTARPHIASGAIRALGVTSRSRSAALPDIPSLSEAGLKDYEVLNWFGMFVPAGTPQPIVARLHAEAAAVLKSPETMQRLAGDGATPVASMPAEFAVFVKSEMTKWAAVAKGAKLQLLD